MKSQKSHTTGKPYICITSLSFCLTTEGFGILVFSNLFGKILILEYLQKMYKKSGLKMVNIKEFIMILFKLMSMMVIQNINFFSKLNLDIIKLLLYRKAYIMREINISETIFGKMF